MPKGLLVTSLGPEPPSTGCWVLGVLRELLRGPYVLCEEEIQ